MTDIPTIPFPTMPHFHEEDSEEKSLRPLTLKEFIGQEDAKQNLKIFIDSASARKKILDHVLFYGPPGLGKTTLAQIIAREMRGNYKATSGPMLSKAGDLAGILTSLQEGDVLFIDEIHRLHPSVEEILYPAMEDFCLDILIGTGPAARSIRIDLPSFTLVGATTRLGLLSNPLRDRFGIPTRLQFYNSQELQEVILRGATVLQAKIDEKAAQEIAKRARGTPRIALRLLRRVWDFAVVSNDGSITETLASTALDRLEVDKVGLDSNDIRYLHSIAIKYNGGPVGIETIAAGMAEDRDAIEETIEPYLMQLGFVERTPKGRKLTLQAYNHLGYEIPPSSSLTQDVLF